MVDAIKLNFKEVIGLSPIREIFSSALLRTPEVNDLIFTGSNPVPDY